MTPTYTLILLLEEFSLCAQPPLTGRRRKLFLEELGAGGELLADHASDAEHGEAAVVELLRLHLRELLVILRLEAQRVPVEVARLVVLADGPLLALERRVEGEHGEPLGDRDDEDHGRPEGLQRRLLEGNVRRHVDLAAEKRMELLRDEEAKGREHGDARVLDLDPH